MLDFRSSHQWSSIKKGVLKVFGKFTGKHLCQSLLLNKVVGHRHSCFLVNFEKILRTPFLQKTENCKTVSSFYFYNQFRRHCVKSVQIRSFLWSVFNPNTVKYGTEKTSYFDTFDTVKLASKNKFYFVEHINVGRVMSILPINHIVNKSQIYKFILLKGSTDIVNCTFLGNCLCW